MSLISAAEVNSIAFVTPITESQILPAFISTAETKFIVPTVTQVIIDKITATPSSYTTLVDDYIKPYLAFAVKYMFYNQLLTETNPFPTSDEQRSAALQEVLSIMEVSRDLLIEYLNANIFETPLTTVSKKVSGFRTRYSTTSNPGSSGSNVNVVDILSSASLASISDPDTINFIQVATGLIKKITFTDLRILLNSLALEIQFVSLSLVHAVPNIYSVSDWNSFFDLPNNGSPFIGVTVDPVNKSIKLYGGGSITLKDYLFSGDHNLVKFNDYSGVILNLKSRVFADCTYLIDVPYLPQAVYFEDVFVLNPHRSSAYNFPKLYTAARDTFNNCFKSIILPSCQHFGNGCASNYSGETFELYLPSCYDIADGAFGGTQFSTITLTIPEYLMTSFGGNPIPAIQYLISVNTVTILDPDGILLFTNA